MQFKWNLEIRKIKDLKDYQKNPRRMTKEQAAHLQASMDKFGLIDKPIINTDNTIIGGHQRVRILKKAGEKEVLCHVPERELTEKEVEELNIRHNRNSGEWNWDILANEWDQDDLLDWGFAVQELYAGNDSSIGEETQEKEEEKVCEKCGKKL